MGTTLGTEHARHQYARDCWFYLFMLCVRGPCFTAGWVTNPGYGFLLLTTALIEKERLVGTRTTWAIGLAPMDAFGGWD